MIVANDKSYYVQKGEDLAGPFPFETLRGMVASKQLKAEDFVCEPGQPWQRAQAALAELFPEEVPPEVARALTQAAEQFGVASKALGKAGAQVAGVAAQLGVDTHLVKGLDKLSAAARSALKGTAERNPRLARELAEQFDSNKKSLTWAFAYTVFGLAFVSMGVLTLDLRQAVLIAYQSKSIAMVPILMLNKLLGFDGALLMLLVGISIAAVRCLWWIFRDEFKAVAIGRKVFLIWMFISAFHTVQENIPHAKLTARAGDVVKETRTTHDTKGFVQQADLYIVPRDKGDVTEITWKDWAKGPVKETAKDLWGNYIILALLNTIYSQLRGLRPNFSWVHFLNLVSFGLWFRFSQYDFDDLNEEPAPESTTTNLAGNPAMNPAE